MSSPAGQVSVVAAAIIRDGRLLAARRSSPSRLAGGWEFPGGKIEAGEDEPEALRRECREELGVEIEVGPRLADARDGELHMSLYAATLRDGEPRPLEDHDELRWLTPAALDSVDWLPIDRRLLPALRRHLDTSPR